MRLPWEATRIRFQAWRRTRRNGEHLPEELWSEAAGLARRLGINRVCRALGLNHTTLKEHVAERQVATRPAQRPQPAPVQPAFVELPLGPGAPRRAPDAGDRFLSNLLTGPVLEVTRTGGERMVLRWPAGGVVDPCGLMATFLGRG
jgi:hypothetical protein